jgi:hypothetical protein
VLQNPQGLAAALRLWAEEQRCTYHLDGTVSSPVDKLLELPNATACEDCAVDRINDKVVVPSLDAECEEVV